MCRNDHARHDSWFKRLPRESVPEEAWAAATEHGILWKLQSEFPELNPSCPECLIDLKEGSCAVCGWEPSHFLHGEGAAA